MPIEISIDKQACQGTEACMRRAPQTFSLDSGGQSQAAANPGDDEATIRSAANSCPHFAIVVRDLSATPEP